jgi:hypothetical protein
MTSFEYMSIFRGIIVALAIENVASSFHHLLEARGRVRWHWMAPTNAIGASIATIGQFWLWWGGRNSKLAEPSFPLFVAEAATAILMYLYCAATLPDAVPETGVDLKDFYFSNRRQFWSLLLAGVVLKMVLEAWSLARVNFDPKLVASDTPYLAGGLVVAAVAACMIFVKNAWWNGLAIIAMTAGTLLLFAPMKL